MNPNRPTISGNYTVNTSIEDLIEVYVRKCVIRLVKERHPELYKEARAIVEDCFTGEDKRDVAQLG